MKNKPLLRLLFVVAVSQCLFSCKSARDFQAASRKATDSFNSNQAIVSPRSADDGAADPAQSAAVADPVNATQTEDLQVDASGDEAYAPATPAAASAKERVIARQLASRSFSPAMKASLQKARDIVKTNQADRTAGKELTRAARKQERTALRSVFKEARADADDDKVLEVILAIFIPPLGVYLHEDEINSKFWIDLVLTLLFFIPGVVYALLVVTDSI